MKEKQVKCAKTPENVNKTGILLITGAVFCRKFKSSVCVGIVS